MADLPDGLIQSLEDIATRLRIDSIRATTAAGSGHPTSCASAADLVAAIFFGAMRFDPQEPRAVTSDRFVLSKGHAAPVLYAAWAEVGTIKREELTTLRDIASDLEGHPTPRLPFVDVATGSLGQGLGVGLGLATGARCAGSDARTFVLLGDGETAEGSVWEAAYLAAHRKADNLIAVVDVNGLGQSGPTMWDHDLPEFQRKFRAAGWRTLVIDGHDMRAVLDAVRRGRNGRGAPTAIIARTVKGKGIEGVEGLEGWHGKPLPADGADRAIAALEGRLRHLPPPPIQRPRRRAARVAPPPAARQPYAPPADGSIATREAYGEALVRIGASDARIVALDGDVKNSTYAEKFMQAHPDRFVECFIAEQNMVSVSAGLAAQGYVPFASSFACFLTRAADQVRMAGISRSNLKLCGSHAGVSIGEDGPSQMALEDIASLRAIHSSTVLHPCDANQTAKLVAVMADTEGIVFLRTLRPNTPVIYDADEEFAVGGSRVVRSADDEDDVTLVGAGVTVHEALKAAEALEEEGISARVIDLYSIKPIDADTLQAAAETTGRIVTVEDHFPEGGVGDAVIAALANSDERPRVVQLAVREMPRSGKPEELMSAYGIDAEHIAAAARQLVSAKVAAS